MKKIITGMLALVFTVSLFAQEVPVEQKKANAKSPMYYQKMGESLAQFAQCKTVEDFNTLSNQFMVIANVEKEEWLPLYYAAHCKIIMAFVETDKDKKDAYLDGTDKWFEQMEVLAPAESEISALKAMYYTAKLTVDPMTRGQEYSMLSNQAAGKALGLNAENPRAKYILLANKIGFAQFFGKDITVECGEAAELLKIWDEYTLESPLHPRWGKDRIVGIVKSCEKK